MSGAHRPDLKRLFVRIMLGTTKFTFFAIEDQDQTTKYEPSAHYFGQNSMENVNKRAMMALESLT